MPDHCTVADALIALDERIDPSKSAGWDVSGLQLGDAAAPVSSIGVCHEVTEAVVEALVEDPVDLLIAYHPLVFRPTRRVVAGRSPTGRAFRLIRSGVALAIAHTSLDAAPGGTADALAVSLGLEDLRRFGPVSTGDAVTVVTFVPAGSVEGVAAAMAEAGAGRVGQYTGCSFRTEGIGAFTPASASEPAVGRRGLPNREPETRIEMVAPASRAGDVTAALVSAHPYEEPAYHTVPVTTAEGFIGRIGSVPGGIGLQALAERAEHALEADGVRVSRSGDHMVEAVAVVPGSGASFIDRAVRAGADALITGDVRHHDMAHASDAGMSVVDVGHAPSERPGMDRLAAIVADVAADRGIGVTRPLFPRAG